LAPLASGGDRGQTPHFLTTYLVNDFLAVDAGCVGFLPDIREQERVKHILISHTHMDHVASLPIFLENVVDGGGEPVTVYGNAAVLECLQKDMFNDRLWPDFIAFSRKGKPFLRLVTLEPGKPLLLEDLRITPVAVNHVVPTCGFILEDAAAAVVIAGDTGPTEEIWKRASAMSHLKAVFLEATFPNSMHELADRSKHLTPALFAEEVRKLNRKVKLLAVHLKARVHVEVAKELEALQLPGLEIAQHGRVYEF
jgi:ribonuclease BN (tRNA processing enzyme)